MTTAQELSKVELIEKYPSCGPATTLDNGTLVEVALSVYARSIRYDTEVLHNRAVECRAELIKRLDDIDRLTAELNLALGTIESRDRNIETVVAENRELQAKITELESQQPSAWVHVSNVLDPFTKTLPTKLSFEKDDTWAFARPLFAAAGAAPDNREKRLKSALVQVFSWPTEEQPDGTVIPVDPTEMLVGAAPAPMPQARAEALAHRRCKRYIHMSNLPHQFDATTLMDFVRDVEKAGAAHVSLDCAYTEKLIEALSENGDPVSVDAAEEFQRLLAAAPKP